MHCATYGIVQSLCASQYFLKLIAFVLIPKMHLSRPSSALDLNAGFSALNRCVRVSHRTFMLLWVFLFELSVHSIMSAIAHANGISSFSYVHGLLKITFRIPNNSVWPRRTRKQPGFAQSYCSQSESILSDMFYFRLEKNRKERECNSFMGDSSSQQQSCVLLWTARFPCLRLWFEWA